MKAQGFSTRPGQLSKLESVRQGVKTPGGHVRQNQGTNLFAIKPREGSLSLRKEQQGHEKRTLPEGTAVPCPPCVQEQSLRPDSKAKCGDSWGSTKI